MPGCPALPRRTGAPAWSPPDERHRGLHSPSGNHSPPSRRPPPGRAVESTGPLIPSGGPARSATGSDGCRGTARCGAGRAAASATGTAPHATGPHRRAALGARAAPAKGAAGSGGPSGPSCFGGFAPLHPRLPRRLRGRSRGSRPDRRSENFARRPWRRARGLRCPRGCESAGAHRHLGASAVSGQRSARHHGLEVAERQLVRATVRRLALRPVEDRRVRILVLGAGGRVRVIVKTCGSVDLIFCSGELIATSSTSKPSSFSR